MYDRMEPNICLLGGFMTLQEKIEILADSAKYDVSCSSSGSSRGASKGTLGNTASCGICHSWSEDGRCISLLKILYTNECVYDCAYCVNRRSNDLPRASFTVDEIVKLVIEFYKRNYIEGLFLSSGVRKSPDETTLEMLEILKRLRLVEGFNGYIHVKSIPGADRDFIEKLSHYADRVSVNIELPSEKSLALLAPNKTKENLLTPMREILKLKSEHPRLIPAGQSTQMIIGASPDSDQKILTLSSYFYQKMKMKRVYYSAYVPVNTNHPILPKDMKQPLLHEHRLYQSDFLLRQYGFSVDELFDEDPNLDLTLDPKISWALRHPEIFPVDIQRAKRETLLRIPGVGPVSVRRILKARKHSLLREEDLKRCGVVLKRARYFILIAGKKLDANPYHLDTQTLTFREHFLAQEMSFLPSHEQLDFFSLFPSLTAPPTKSVIKDHLEALWTTS